LKFLIDMPVTPQAVSHLQAAGHDAIHASAAGLATADDTQVLEVGRADGRIVVTADLDYPRLLALLKADTPGVILFRAARTRTRRCSACSTAFSRKARTWSTRSR
jgi:predicted nuclease of predicted toxin-antitoxin system